MGAAARIELESERLAFCSLGKSAALHQRLAFCSPVPMNNDGLKVARLRSACDYLRRARATIAKILIALSTAAKFDMQP